MTPPPIIAIDPDADKSGIAMLTYNSAGKEVITYMALDFPHAIDYVNSYAKAAGAKVIIEAGWRNRKANFHGGRGAVAEKIARDVGANHQTGKLLVKMLGARGVEVEEVPPLAKKWKGRGGKITHDELRALIPNLDYKRTNQDARDAILLAWVYRAKAKN